MDTKEVAFEKAVWWVIGLCYGLMGGYALCLTHEKPVIVSKPVVSLETANELRRRAYKHGLENTRHCFPEWYYINEKGQKCLLK